MINEEKNQGIESSVDDIGVVVNCIKLNVRKEPDKTSNIIQIIDALTEVRVIVKDSTYNFYKVILPSGIEGYCMKKFIELKS